MTATNWGAYNLPAIWQMLQPEDGGAGADRVLAWDGLATSVREQHRRLVRAGEDLAAVWPPETNASARAFLDRLGELATSMQETLTCAEDVRVGLRGVVKALDEAKRTMGALAADRALVSHDWIPRFIDHAEDEYDVRAQQVMARAEAAIADHTPQIKAPPLYAMSVDPGAHAGAGGTNAAAVRATPVAVAAPHDPVLPGTPTQATGLELSGVPTTPALPPTGAVAGPGQLAPPGPASGVLPGAVIGAVPAAGGRGGLLVTPGRPGGSGGRAAPPPRRALPSGAVLGQGGLAGRARAARRPDGVPNGGVADEQWEARTGVAPVIAPDTPARHDPGPGIIGLRY